MHFALTEEQAAIQETALTFAKERIAPHAAEWDEKCHFPVDVIREMAALGMATIYVPADQGGSGLSRLDGALIMEALAYGCPAISGYVSIHNMVAWMVGKVCLLRADRGRGCRSSPPWNGCRATASPSPAPAPMLPRSRPRRGARATTMSSTAPSSSSPAPAPPTSISSSRAPAMTAPTASRHSP